MTRREEPVINEPSPSGNGLRIREGLLPEAFTLAFLVTLLVGVIGVGAVAGHYLRQQVQAGREQAGESAARALALGLAVVADDDAVAAARVLSQFCRDQQIVRAEWIGTDGEIRYRWPADQTPATSAGVDHPATRESWAGEALEATVAVTLSADKPGGTLYVAVSPAWGRVHADRLWRNTGLVAGASLVLFILVYRRLRRHLRPISAIYRNLRGYASGLESQLQTLALGDAMGQIAGSWNRLIKELAELRERSRTASGDGDSGVLQRFESRTLRQILNQLPLGVLGVTDDGLVKHANPAAESMLRCVPDELVGKPLKEVVDEEVVARTLDKARSASAGEHSLDRTSEDGENASTMRFSVLPAAGRGAAGERIITIQDVTYLREAERARDNFLYHVTHELRTPLTNIQAYAETLTKPDFDDEQTRKELYNVIISETQRLSRLIENVLNISQLEVGTARMEIDDVDLVRILRQIVQDHLGAADEKRIDLTLTLPPKTPKIRGDKQRLAVLFNNLIGNAIKYTPSGGSAKVELAVAEQTVRVCVSDNGAGIAPADQPHVFDKFYRGESDAVQDVPGTGLGLAIAREVARLHGGDIRLDSAPEQGVTFTVELPRPVAEPHPIGAA